MEYSYILLLMLFGLFSVYCEPECSRFHYEQMTLEKMIRQELNVEKMLGEYRDEFQRMKNEINDLRSETENCKTGIDLAIETNDKIRGDMKKEIAELKNETKKYQTALDEVKEVKQTAREVIFHAKTLKNTSPSNGERFIFTDAMSNVGSGYSTSDGRFTTPVNGTYAFTVQLCVEADAGNKQYSIVKSTGEVLVRSQLGNPGSGYYDCDALSIFETLNTGESVWVENRQNSKSYKEIPGQFWNYFSGVMLKNA